MTDSTTQDEWLRLQALRSYQVLGTAREEPFDRVVRVARSILRAPIGLVSLIDHDRQWFKARSGLIFCDAPREPSLCARTIESDDPFIVADTHADPRFRALPLVVEPPYVRSYIGVPLRTPAGYRIGTLCVMDTEVRQPDLEQIGILTDLAALVMDELELRLVATTDGLTGALSRRAFLTTAARDLARVRRHGGELSCILLDLDHFKRINDTHGHAAGDRALQEVVMLLKSAMRERGLCRPSRRRGIRRHHARRRPRGCLRGRRAVASTCYERLAAHPGGRGAAHRQRRCRHPEGARRPHRGPAAAVRRGALCGESGRPQPPGLRPSRAAGAALAADRGFLTFFVGRCFVDPRMLGQGVSACGHRRLLACLPIV